MLIRRGDEEVETRTDPLAEFRLRDVPTGQVELIAEKAGGRGRLALELRAGDEHLSIELSLE